MFLFVDGFSKTMKITKLFQKGKHQIVQLPKEFNFSGNHVYVKRVGKAVMLLPYQKSWQTLLDSLSMFSADFMSERNQAPVQKRS